MLQEAEPAMIRIRIDELLKEHERTFYWLAKETGVSHTTLWRLKKDKARGITFNTLERVCKALSCQPGDVLQVGRTKTNKKK
jgi:putative transcriptional regulator